LVPGNGTSLLVKTNGGNVDRGKKKITVFPLPDTRLYYAWLSNAGNKESQGDCLMKKTFDAVNFQRKIRAELSNQYLENREAFLTELKEKYGKLKKSGGRHTHQITPAQN
jgi:hypothetical protein